MFEGMSEGLLDVLFYISGLSDTIAILVVGGIIYFSIRKLFDFRSFSEKTKQETTSQYFVEEKELRRLIEAERDEAEKKLLRQQAFNLRQEYESLFIENLQTKDGEIIKDWREVLLSARKRLLREEQRLLARNNANLRNGIFMALAGVAMPTYYILSGMAIEVGGNWDVFIVSYWPFFTMGVIIEIIAIFYLRLYALTERRLERNKNELTNIELRLTAGLMLHDKTDENKFNSIADIFAKEERNFVLKKNETSAITDSDKLDIDRAVEIAIKAMKAGL